MVSVRNISKNNIAALLGCAIFFTLISCEEDLAEINKNKNVNFPSQVIYNSEILQRDSGMIKLRATAPLIEKYELIDSPYIVARKGINILFYDKKKPDSPGSIKADFAKFNERKKFYEARGNIRIVSSDKQMFAMQSVFWDQNKKLIYTTDTVYVTDKDGSTLVGANGMRAKDDFSEYTFFNNSGDINAGKIPESSR
ncbi:LPS export ABC transporter periplasmic protein LptC [Chryseobacterium salipaludis]|uniref:LPS export ABC transporter periplasmic protein LptC n=1 Tax=Chryseobacterium TaxID=59732 RepID=UPI001FF553B6|nr:MULTISPECIES: LPS export ABC transporter periplasmic protein LptC [Chryseobacterium]MCJ8496665.1 LPS export ABC transporter periplasmic protein LptC [Chryseobacterium salipaludis]MCX3296146.1 LPS export ABC transporter periplasmic protein LptC [Planobacterium sp. JC490]